MKLGKQAIIAFVGIVLVLVIAGALLLLLHGELSNTREEKIPPLREYGIAFYDSPKTVAKKLGLTMTKGSKAEGVTTDYFYTAPLRGYETDFWFNFYDNRELIEVSALVKCGDPEAAESLRQALIAELTEVYESDERFKREDRWQSMYDTREDRWQLKYDTEVTRITLNSGPYGMGYELYVLDGDLILYFYDQYE